MDATIVEKIRTDPAFQAHARRRRRISWAFSGVLLGGYAAYISFLAFRPEIWARPIVEGSLINIGMAAAFVVILGVFVLIFAYVRKANSEFDVQVAKILERAKR